MAEERPTPPAVEPKKPKGRNPDALALTSFPVEGAFTVPVPDKKK